ncbi:DUF1236 domain-containing protein [Tianweitania sp. BSSL-BM11]|uniref:DUF1236 domain-containing protein n=1 Tax=Tianweitania aestuarii TaxID=2814886 RepID=A0ABS5S184_9HYPH|nr:DUF1236 domain-containing protein [Tianweitania aestuarii]MBS9722297.1 DUF1236 domain-containing protein [Tianweitania aestuarii]
MSKFRLLAATATILAATAGASFAQTAVTATTDLNLRAGPGPQYPVIGTLGVDQQATLDGCAQGSKWCQLTVDGKPSWAYSDYLTSEFSTGNRVIVTERPAEAVPVVEYRETAPATTTTTTTTTAGTGGGGAPGAAAGTIGGVVVGALIGGPVGAAIGGVAGAATGGVVGEAVQPTPVVREYVTTNRVDPVYLEGEVVVGAGLPENVALTPVPDYEYEYAYINGQPVLVDPSTRRIVSVVR